jgi:hypothetical protein
MERFVPAALSVVVVSMNPLSTLERCLASLTGQHEVLEVLVVRDPSRTAWSEGDTAALRLRHPMVTWIAAPDGETVPRMRTLGLSLSRGTVVALIEDDCVPAPDWCSAVMAGHDEESVAVGGAVEPDEYPRALDWAVFFSDYARFMLPFAQHRTWVLPGNNVSYPRHAVRDLIDTAGARGLEEAFVHKHWHEAGRAMKADPRIVVRNVHRSKVADVTAIPFHHARAFAGHRAEGMGATRWLLAAGAIALPVVMTGRIITRVLQRARHRGHLVEALGWLLVFAACWSAGEWCGYVAGPGRAASRWR